MKKFIPLIVAVVAFVLVLVMMQPPPQMTVVVAARDLSRGHIVRENDIRMAEFPAEMIPADAVTDPVMLVGESLVMDRTEGDIIQVGHIGEPIKLRADERAIAIHVTDSSGLGGLLKAGDKVGVNAVIVSAGGQQREGSFSKAAIEDLKVLYISPDFRAEDPDGPSIEGTPDLGTMAMLSANEREDEGIIVLAVSIRNKTILYDYSDTDVMIPGESRIVNAIELLAALDNSEYTKMSLYLMPDEGAESFTTGGLWMPDLIVTAGPTPTQTETPWGYNPTTYVQTLNAEEALTQTATALGTVGPAVEGTPDPAAAQPIATVTPAQ
jgi:Flp pilus assembly protein CpaB